jgi:SAM-dependent methyltransferase
VKRTDGKPMAETEPSDVHRDHTVTQGEHTVLNRAFWDIKAASYAGAGRRSWACEEPRWGIWGIPQSELPVLPDDLQGKDVVELGCGTAYVSAWAARRGARVVGIDNSPAQLTTARTLQREHDLHFELHLGNAERTPFPDSTFDLTISEYGASIWCDPSLWIPEAARLLRPGGHLIFMRNSTLLMMCEPRTGTATNTLLRSQFDLRRLDWDEPEGRCVEFHLPHGELLRLLRAKGFVIEDLIEVRAPQGATTNYPYVTGTWARSWPTEEVWFARKETAPAPDAM